MHIENLSQEYFIDWFVQRIPRGARVLEMGYGDGLVTAALAKLDCDLTVIEGAHSLVMRARERHPFVTCLHELFEEHRPTKLYDVVLASHILEHVDDPRTTLNAMASWVAPAGKVVVAVPNRNSLHRQLAVVMGLQPALDTLSKRDRIVGHQRVYSFETLAQDLRRSGLEVVETNGCSLKVLPNSMMLDYSRELLRGLNAISSQLPKELLANIAVVAVKGGES
jgi:2-polyprenyl-3-methyl-5-hydroxy-6-metoxy-1,4-benzoquinol methylase